MGADRGRDRRRRQRLHERPARRPRRPHAARPAASRPPRTAPPSAAPPSRSQPSPPTSPAPASRWSSGRSSSSAPAPSTSSRATRPRRTTRTWDASGAPDGATEIRAVITDAAGNVRTTAVIPVTVDSTGPSVTLTDPGAVVSGTVSLTATHGRRRRPGRLRRLAGRWRHLDGDRLRHERAVRHAAGHEHRSPTGSTTCARSATTRSATRRRPPSARTSGSTTPRRRSSPRHPADGSVSASANQIVLTASEPVIAPGALLDGAAAPAPVISGNDAHLRDRRARRRPARALRRARGRERHPHAVPRRSHDREHAAAEPAAGREVSVPDVDDDPRGAGSARHGSDAGIAPGRRLFPQHRTSSFSASIRSCRRPRWRPGSHRAAR